MRRGYRRKTANEHKLIRLKVLPRTAFGKRMGSTARKEMPARGGHSRLIPKGAGGSSLPRQHGHVPARLRQR